MTVPARFLIPLLVVAAFFAAAGEMPGTWTGTSPLVKELTALNTRLTRAYEEEDLPRLRALLTEDHIHNNVFGSVMNKETFLGDIESGVLVFESYTTPELHWFIEGDMAVATGLIEAKAIRAGKPVPATRFRFTRIFVRRDGQWKVLLFQNTMAPS